MSKIPSTLPPELLALYGYKCSYCHRPIGLSDYRFFESDHIYPASKDGPNTIDNRTPACRECNRLKSNKTQWKDPDSGCYVSLFAPNEDVWEEHFSISELTGVIIGISPKGRASVDLLELNKRLRNERQLFLENAITTIEDKDLLSQISLLRYLRLSCEYSHVISLGMQLFSNERVTRARERFALQMVIATQIVETFFTRSKDKDDILKGIWWSVYFKKYFQKVFSNEREYASVFDNFIATLVKQLVSLGHKNSTLLKNIILFNLSKSVGKNTFESLASSVLWKIKLGDLSCDRDLSFIFNRLEYLYDLSLSDPSQFIYTLIDVLDIASLISNKFYQKSDCIIANAVKANTLVKTHFAFDCTLFSLLQRRLLALKMDCDLSQIMMSKEDLIVYARRYSLFNEVRQINCITDQGKKRQNVGRK